VQYVEGRWAPVGGKGCRVPYPPGTAREKAMDSIQRRHNEMNIFHYNKPGN